MTLTSPDEVRQAYEQLCAAGTTEALVVRSSSAIEDTGDSSMAGRFTSVLDVVGWDAFVDADPPGDELGRGGARRPR